MSADFQRALAFVLKAEGGYTNHPSDRGGPTNKGILQREYDQYRRDNGLPSADVRDILNAEVEATASAAAERLALARRPRPLARALASRGVTAEGGGYFLNPTLKSLFPDPSSFTDMDRAADALIAEWRQAGAS
jgi:hypothetical protein